MTHYEWKNHYPITGRCGEAPNPLRRREGVVSRIPIASEPVPEKSLIDTRSPASRVVCEEATEKRRRREIDGSLAVAA